jgi:hypothetical protein
MHQTTRDGALLAILLGELIAAAAGIIYLI